MLPQEINRDFALKLTTGRQGGGESLKQGKIDFLLHYLAKTFMIGIIEEEIGQIQGIQTPSIDETIVHHQRYVA